MCKLTSQCCISCLKAMTQGGGRKVVNVGNYRFTGKRLGKGNFARVDEALHTVLNVKVGDLTNFLCWGNILKGRTYVNFCR